MSKENEMSGKITITVPEYRGYSVLNAVILDAKTASDRGHHATAASMFTLAAEIAEQVCDEDKEWTVQTWKSAAKWELNHTGKSESK